MNESHYKIAEMEHLYRQLKKVEDAPLFDRREARKHLLAAMHYTPLIAERIEWVLTGNYGYGAMNRMQSIAHATRGNRAAQAIQLIGALEWLCPAAFTAQTWKKLSMPEQLELNVAVLTVLDSERDHKGEKL